MAAKATPALCERLDMLVLAKEAERAAYQDAVASAERFKRLRAMRERIASDVYRLDSNEAA